MERDFFLVFNTHIFETADLQVYCQLFSGKLLAIFAFAARGNYTKIRRVGFLCELLIPNLLRQRVVAN